MNVRTRNILTVVVAVLGFAAFIVWAEFIGRDNDDNRLEALSTTTTAVTLPRVTTTSTPPTTLVVVPSTQVTIAPQPTVTTARTTVTTTRRTTTTVRRTSTTRGSTGTTTATTVPPGPNGRVTEASDNSAGFVHNSDGSTSESATGVGTNPAPFVFKITTKVLSASGTSAQVRFTVEITNQRGRRITFPGGLKVNLNITPSSGAPFTLVMNADTVSGFDNGETITVGTTAPIEGYGSYTVNGSVEVDYGS